MQPTLVMPELHLDMRRAAVPISAATISTDRLLIAELATRSSTPAQGSPNPNHRGLRLVTLLGLADGGDATCCVTPLRFMFMLPGLLLGSRGPCVTK